MFACANFLWIFGKLDNCEKLQSKLCNMFSWKTNSIEPPNKAYLNKKFDNFSLIRKNKMLTKNHTFVTSQKLIPAKILLKRK